MYTSDTLPASRGLEVMFTLLDVVGDSAAGMMAQLGAIAYNRDSGAGDAPIMALLNNRQVVGTIMRSIAKAAKDKTWVFRALCEGTHCSQLHLGTAEGSLQPHPSAGDLHEHFDLHFSGRYGHLAMVIIWLTYHNFFQGVPARASRAGQATQDASAAQGQGETPGDQAG